MTPKQQRFVEEYLIDLNAKQAAIRAGYSEKTAEVQGSRLLSHAKVAAAIQKAQAERSERTGITQDQVILELARLGLSDVRKLFDENGNLRPITDLDDATAASIASIEVVSKPGPEIEEGRREVEYVHKIKMWDKNSALEKLGKHFSLFLDRTKIEGELSHTIQVADSFPEEG